jgi:RNA polymerase-binding transcription factor DksA
VLIKNFKLRSEKVVLEREESGSAENAPEYKQPKSSPKSTAQLTASQNKTRQETPQKKSKGAGRASGSKISLPPPLNPLRSETPDTRTNQTKKKIPSTQNGVEKQKGIFSAPSHKNKRKRDVNDLNKRNAPMESKNYPWKDRARAGPRMINPDTKLERNLQNRKCKECGKEIAEHTMMARPDTKYCGEHIQLNNTMLPTHDMIGSRQDFKKDSARNKFRSGLPKKL